MKIPFSTDEFLKVFETYNLSVWPLQLILYLLAIIALLSAYRGGKRATQVITAVLSLLWLWMGSIYHIMYFSAINKAAYAFGLLFIVQSFIFVYAGILNNKISFKPRRDKFTVIGITFIAYALILYPLLGIVLGHVYPKSPTFGVPCPTTIFTFGVLLFSSHRVPWYVLIIPLALSIVGLSAAFNLSIYEDIGLTVSGLVSTVVLTRLIERKG